MIYNQILSIFYNHKEYFNDAIEIIKFHASKIDNFYEQLHQSRKKIINNIIITEDTPIEKAIKDVQTKMINNIVNPLMRSSDIKKNVNYEINIMIQKISDEYKNFIGQSMNNNSINVENRDFININDTIYQIADHIIGNTKGTYIPLEDKLINFKTDVLNRIYDDIDIILKLFNPSYNLKRRDMLQIPELEQASTNFLNIQDFNTLTETYNNDKKMYVFKDNCFVFGQALGAHIGRVNMNVPDNINNIINMLIGKNIYCLNDDVTTTMFDLFIYLYGSSLYSKPVDVKKSDIITYYNMLVDGKLDYSSVISRRIIISERNEPNIVVHPGILDKTKKIESGIVNVLNKILPEHITNLNLWLALDNITSIQPYNFEFPNQPDPAIYNTIVSAQLPIFIINENPDSNMYDRILYEKDITGNIIQAREIPQPIDIQEIQQPPEIQQEILTNANKTLSEIGFIPNTFSLNIKTADYMDFLKKRFILWSMNIIGPIFNEIERIVSSSFQNLEEFNSFDIKVKTVTLIIKILDRLFINTVNSEIYLLSIKKLKTELLLDRNNIYSTFKDRIIQYLDKIITKTNTSIKLDKNINDMVQINTTTPINSVYNMMDIIDERNITKIFDTPDSDPTQITRDEKIGNYLVYYPKDYNTIQPITNRMCMYNTTAIITTILKYGKSIDYYKQDINGFTPIYYGIQSGNYLIIKKIIELLKESLINNQLSNQYESPILYAYNMIRNTCIHKPNFKMLNITYINNLLLSSDINRNIPKGYYNKYKKILYLLNQFLKNPIDYTFEGLITIENDKRYHHIIDQDIINQIIDSKESDELNYECDIELFDKYIKRLNSIIIGKHPINNIIGEIKTIKTQSNIKNYIKDLKNITRIFEERYKSNRLYKYIYNVRPNKIDDTLIASTNNYNLLLITTGILSILDIFTYYINIILKTLYTSNIFNFDFERDNDVLKNQLIIIVDQYIKTNIFDLVRSFYFIKLDQYDNMISNSQTYLEEYIMRLLYQLSQNGVLAPETQVYNNIKQFINPHIIELLSKTLQYNQVILDVFHRWVTNLYHYFRTFDELIN
jgi:hypothetical protein